MVKNHPRLTSYARERDVSKREVTVAILSAVLYGAVMGIWQSDTRAGLVLLWIGFAIGLLIVNFTMLFLKRHLPHEGHTMKWSIPVLAALDSVIGLYRLGTGALVVLAFLAVAVLICRADNVRSQHREDQRERAKHAITDARRRAVIPGRPQRQALGAVSDHQTAGWATTERPPAEEADTVQQSPIEVRRPDVPPGYRKGV